MRLNELITAVCEHVEEYGTGETVQEMHSTAFKKYRAAVPHDEDALTVELCYSVQERTGAKATWPEQEAAGEAWLDIKVVDEDGTVLYEAGTQDNAENWGTTTVYTGRDHVYTPASLDADLFNPETLEGQKARDQLAKEDAVDITRDALRIPGENPVRDELDTFYRDILLMASTTEPADWETPANR